ncbi:MAG TPA: glutamine-hydrolyzing carbamoyl-phosphate synthase small subunit [Bacteroidales bacterium]|nr:glutamine-hydrolyzing carbamoyl-phosphate synthase small subunit [Bacteroidales bacterium]HPF01807.1 glutamine-hydrolyzing carbamoyl-phosphate synthase small subunit [Bacteroidales bacterium]HPJ59699.1 glutamine-hydrolyzing carbamoyl-phosphate synthase small subunit [Bacteroidales bacterium]HPR11328.1 glutamine-hydrolyzing carbamoyl-phosphate synthase small subunit [Bacteroidales bacterium]HRW86160.1 glutamine-hydrolyzing carbamoyl-phosphate synthase small subunit [Bacteroidales bacterium]
MTDRIKVKLTLEDGTEYHGRSFGSPVAAAGEVVFNTAMTGYPESLTDPSYRGQLLCLTYPLVGNYGAPARNEENDLYRFYESSSIHISGLIVSDYSFEYSHWNASESLDEWLKRNNIPGIYGVDTRALTKRIREKGAMPGKLEPVGTSTEFIDPNRKNLVAEVSTGTRKTYGKGKYRIILVDCGVKYNIIRNLLKRDTTIIRVPWDYDYHQEEYDGLFLSNGPGDPKMCDITIGNIRKSFDKAVPVFGICLGNQLMALASGADTYKLKYGHRSHNQPVLEVGTNKAYITSQNHGYAVDNNTLGKDWDPLFININDNTNEGMKHKTKPFFSTQFHPEASGGPTDTDYLFDEFIDNIKKAKR